MRLCEWHFGHFTYSFVPEITVFTAINQCLCFELTGRVRGRCRVSVWAEECKGHSKHVFNNGGFVVRRRRRGRERVVVNVAVVGPKHELALVRKIRKQHENGPQLYAHEVGQPLVFTQGFRCSRRENSAEAHDETFDPGFGIKGFVSGLNNSLSSLLVRSFVGDYRKVEEFSLRRLAEARRTKNLRSSRRQKGH